MENSIFNRFGTMIDCSRNAVMNVDTVKEWINLTSDLGYNSLMLYIEDTYEIENEPYFGHLRGRYSVKELKEIDKYAEIHNMEVIPCIQTLAHLNALFHWSEYSSINDCNDIILVDDEKSYELIDKMFNTFSVSLKTKIIHIGMDEATFIGRGKYQDKYGYKDRAEILLNHLVKVSNIAKKYGFTLVMWGDMFIRLANSGEYYVDDFSLPDELKAKIPDNVIINYWDYYSFDDNHYDKQIKLHSKIKDPVWFAGGLWTWTGFVPRNEYSIKATKAAFKACKENDVKNVFLTLWGDNGSECSKFSVLPSLYYASRLAVGITDEKEIKNGFFEKFGIDFDSFMQLDIPGSLTSKGELPRNPDKYYLYEDLFMGQFDYTVKENGNLPYLECANKTKQFISNKRFGYLFENISNLCSLVSLKIDLGVRTRKAYLSGNKKALCELLDDYNTLLFLIDKLYRSQEKQWMKENKPHGFDVLDLRFGGLTFRVRHCKERIEAYINGELDSIIELEEPVLNYNGKNSDDFESVYENRWQRIVSANAI